jgi:hypothetical protein
MPRHASPCGVCIDENVAQLMHLPDRCFPVLLTEPRFVEALLIPFHAHGKPIGTVWNRHPQLRAEVRSGGRADRLDALAVRLGGLAAVEGV